MRHWINGSLEVRQKWRSFLQIWLIFRSSLAAFQALWSMEETDFETEHISHLWSRHMAHHHVTLINLYLHTKFHPNRWNFLRTDGGMYERTTIETCLLDQLRGKANNPKHSKTKLLCFSRLLWHSARKRDGLILQCPCAHAEHNKYIKKHNNWMRQCNSQENELILRTD